MPPTIGSLRRTLKKFNSEPPATIQPAGSGSLHYIAQAHAALKRGLSRVGNAIYYRAEGAPAAPAAPPPAQEVKPLPKRFVRNADGSVIDLDANPQAVPDSARGIPGTEGPSIIDARNQARAPSFVGGPQDVVEGRRPGASLRSILTTKRAALEPGQMRMVLPDGTVVTRTGTPPAEGQPDNTRPWTPALTRERALTQEGYNLPAMAQGGDGSTVSLEQQWTKAGRVPGMAGVLRRKQEAARAAAENAALPARQAAEADAEVARIKAAGEGDVAKTTTAGDQAVARTTGKASILTAREKARADAAAAAGSTIEAQQKNRETAQASIDAQIKTEMEQGLFNQTDANGNPVTDTLRSEKGKYQQPRTDQAKIDARRRQLMEERGLIQSAKPAITKEQAQGIMARYNAMPEDQKAKYASDPRVKAASQLLGA